jgi:hypothetical protein
MTIQRKKIKIKNSTFENFSFFLTIVILGFYLVFLAGNLNFHITPRAPRIFEKSKMARSKILQKLLKSGNMNQLSIQQSR